jgi:hypothetical protein
VFNPWTGTFVWVQPQPVYHPPGYGQYLQNELLERQITGGRDIPDPGDVIYRPYPVYDPYRYNQYLRNELLERVITGGRDIPDPGDVIYRPW